MKRALAICCISATALQVWCQTAPNEDYVPNPETAVAIAEAVLVPVYGRKVVESELPYQATLDGSVWKVSGTLHCGVDNMPSGHTARCVGGVAEVEISKEDAHIVSMTHYK